VPHPCGVQGCGFSGLLFSLSRWPIPIRPIFARYVFRMEKKSAPLTKTVKSAAPGNSIQPQSLTHLPFESAMPDTI
jgi:hypothetical protein